MINRKIQEEAKTEKSIGANEYRPIKMKSGQHTNNLTDEIQCWQDWIKECFNIPAEQLMPKIMHIPEAQWAEISKNEAHEEQISEELK